MLLIEASFLFFGMAGGLALQSYKTAILKDLQRLEPSTTAAPSSTDFPTHIHLLGSMQWIANVYCVHFNPFLSVFQASPSCLFMPLDPMS